MHMNLGDGLIFLWILFLRKARKGINHNSKILHGTWQYFCISKVEKDRRVSRNRWDDQQIKENVSPFEITKGTFKFQKFGIRV